VNSSLNRLSSQFRVSYCPVIGGAIWLEYLAVITYLSSMQGLHSLGSRGEKIINEQAQRYDCALISDKLENSVAEGSRRCLR